MVKAPASVTAYIAAQPVPARGVLRLVRRAIRSAVRDAEETISYGIPTYQQHGRAVLHFASWKHHYSLYPASAGLARKFATELAPYEIRGSTIRFPFTAPVPVRLIARIAKFRAKEIARR